MSKWFIILRFFFHEQRGKVFSARLAGKHNYELTEQEKIVDSSMIIAYHITDDPGFKAEKVNAASILKVVEQHAVTSFGRSIHEKLKAHWESSGKPKELELTPIFQMINDAGEHTGMTSEGFHEIAKSHELYKLISQRMGSANEKSADHFEL